MGLYSRMIKKIKKVTVMIQARTGSTRFPKKTLAQIEGKPMIWYVINRLKKIKSVDQIALITTRKKEDRILLKFAEKEGIIGFAGDVNDLLNRHYQCALKYDADPIIRITSDCPLVDPKIISKMLDIFLKENVDYMSNFIKPSFPNGLDVEIFSLSALKNGALNAKLRSEREHMFSYYTKNSKKFKLRNYENKKNLSELRWTVDHKKDLKFVREIYSRMKPKTIFFMNDILKIIIKEPSLSAINQEYDRLEGYNKSIKHDKKIQKKL